MSTVQHYGSYADLTLTQDYYGQPFFDGYLACMDAENKSQLKMRSAGTLSHLYARVTVNDKAASTVRLRINNGDGNQVLSIGDSATGEFEDITHTDVVAAGNTVDVKITTGSGGTRLTIVPVSLLFEPSSNAVCKYVSGNGDVEPTGTDVGYIHLVGYVSAVDTADEIPHKFKMKTTGTFKNLGITVWSNSVGTSTFRLRKNGANGNLAASVLDHTTGIFEDIINTDDVAVDDLFNYSFVRGGSAGGIAIGVFNVELWTTDNKFHVFCGFQTGRTYNANIIRYDSPGGYLVGFSDETYVENKVLVSTTFSNLMCYVSSNTLTAASILKFRKNVADGNQSVSIAASTTGYFEDNTHTDSCSVGDEINYCIITGATGTSLVMRYIGVLADASMGTTTTTTTTPPPTTTSPPEEPVLFVKWFGKFG